MYLPSCLKIYSIDRLSVFIANGMLDFSHLPVVQVGSGSVASYVQTRGSIPLFWQQRPDLRWEEEENGSGSVTFSVGDC